MSDNFPFNHFIKFEKSKPNNSDIQNNPLVNNITEAPKDLVNSTVNTVENQPLRDSSFNKDELQSISDEIQKYLKSNISTPKYNAFFKNSLILTDIYENSVRFTAATSFIKKMIESHYLPEIKQGLFNLLATEQDITISVLGSTTNESLPTIRLNESDNTEINTKNAGMGVKSLSFKLPVEESTHSEIKDKVDSVVIKHNNNVSKSNRIDRSKTFNNFIVGPSNNMAHAFALACAKSPGSVYPQLYIHGNSGLGKTHILYALCNYISEKQPHLRICFTTANDFMSEMVMSIQGGKINDFRNKYVNSVDVLIIDDIHELKNKSRTQAEFFNIFNQLQSKGKQLVFTSDKAPKEIAGIEDRIRTRLSAALLIDIQQPDLETRIAILKKKALEKDILLDDEVINLIASCVKTNVRELEGNLVKLGAYSDLMNVDIDLEIAKEQLNLTESLDDKILTVETITKAVAAYFKIPLGDIKGKTRKKEVAMARHIAMYMNHKILKKTLEEIGEFFSNRDHSTVIHGIKKIQNLIKEDSKMSQQIYEIESRL